MAQSAVPEKTAPVQTAQGHLRGETMGDIRVFRGVPYAEPPVGGLRFHAPRRPLRWTGIREANTFADAAVQPGQKDAPHSEDCLYLNIWVPAGKGPFPVFLWVHGGGFTGGRASEPIYDGTHFAEAGIMCVTVGYRLGVFGFLDVSQFFGPVYSASADNALLDLIAALQWLEANAASFGGDPNQVTIGGESAGAKLADTLLGMPQAQSLFHQVISESGGAERVWLGDRAIAVAKGFADAWTAQTGLSPDALKTAPARQIIDVQENFTKTWPGHFPLRPETSERLLSAMPLEAIRKGSARGKRLLIGTNRDESALFLGPHPQAVTAADLGSLTLDTFKPLEERYRALYPQDTEERRRLRSVTAEEYWIPSLRLADAHVHAGGEAYVYRLDFPGRGRFAGLAFHSYDLRFVWNFFATGKPDAAERLLADGMHAAWVAFIKGQPPAGPGLPPWPKYTLHERPTMIFDQLSYIDLHPGAGEFELWDGLLEN